MTKDGDFSRLIAQLGSPLQVIWLRCGNTSNTYLKQMLIATLPSALALIEVGEPMVEITDRS